MENLPVEYLIKSKAPKGALAYKIIMILACIAAVFTIPSMAVWGLFLTAILVVFTILLFRYYNREYEYSLMAGDLTIDCITAQSARRRCGVYDISKAVLIARPDSQEALRLSGQQLRTTDYTSNTVENKDKAVVIHTYDESKEMVRIFIEPNEELLEELKNSAPRDAFKIEISAE